MHGQMSWRVRDKVFVWERPLRQSDLKALGSEAPSGEILGARVEHEGAKLDGYSAILELLERIGLEELEELIIEAWLLRAPKRLASAYLASQDQR
jgi:hypothetical protein